MTEPQAFSRLGQIKDGLSICPRLLAPGAAARRDERAHLPAYGHNQSTSRSRPIDRESLAIDRSGGRQPAPPLSRRGLPSPLPRRPPPHLPSPRMLSPPIQRQTSTSSIGPSTPPSPGPIRPGRAVKNYFELYPRTSSTEFEGQQPSPLQAGSRTKPQERSREGADSGRRREARAAPTSSTSREGGGGGPTERDRREPRPHRPRSTSGSAKTKSSTASPRTPRTLVPPPRTSSAGAPASTPPDRVPPRTSSRVELNGPNSPLSPSFTGQQTSSPTPYSPHSPHSSDHMSQSPRRARPPPLSPPASSPSRPHHLPSSLVPSAKLSPFEFAASPQRSPDSRSFDDRAPPRSPNGRMSLPRTPPSAGSGPAGMYSSRSVSSDTMDALVESMHSGPSRSAPPVPVLSSSRSSSANTRKGKERAIYSKESSESDNDLQPEPVRPRPGRPARPLHFARESSVTNGGRDDRNGKGSERVSAWVDQEQVDADRRRRRQGLPSLNSPPSISTPPQRSHTLNVDTSLDSPSSYGDYLTPGPSPSRPSPSPTRATSYSAAEERWQPIPVGHPAPSPPPKSPTYIPSIDDIIKAGLAREAAQGARGPLPSVFAPPISPASRTSTLPSARVASQSATNGSERSVDLSRRVKEVSLSDGDAAIRRRSVESADEEVDSPTSLGHRARWPYVNEHLSPNRLDVRAPGNSTFSASSPPPSAQSADALPVQQSRSISGGQPRARPNSTAFERSPSSVGGIRPMVGNARQSSSSSVRSVSMASTALRPTLSRVSTDSSPATPQQSNNLRQDPNLDHALLLRSPRLTRLLTLNRQPNRGLVVSLSDVGASNGHPVFVYLGLGGVRYLTALFDELAESMGLRLVTIDRWGLGKTGEVAADRRGFLEWGAVVDEVADQLGVTKFSLLAHSAGAPYSLATCLRLPERIFGSVHLLAPWVSMEIDGGYRWLKYVPSGVIKATQAAEWRMAGWRMGKAPSLPVEPVGYTAPSSSGPSSPISPTFPVDGCIAESAEESYDDLADFGGSYPNGRDQQQPGGSLRRKTSKLFSGGGSGAGSPSRAPNLRHSLSTSSIRSATSTTPERAPLASVGMNDYPSLPVAKAKPLPTEPTTFASPRSNGTPTSTKVAGGGPGSRSTSPLPPQAGRIDLGTALLRASHAENQRGTADLLAIMEKSGEWGFSYTDVVIPVKVWYGDRDDKISEKSVRWMERSMPDCTVRIMKGEGHNLLSSTRVVIEVLESIAKEAGTL